MNPDIILRKLDLITTELPKLKELSKMSQEQYLGNFTNYYTGERIIEKIVGAAIDINTHLIISLGEQVPDTYYDSFIIAGRLKILPQDFAEAIAESARMRNKLIHEYEGIDQKRMYEFLEKAVFQYAKYVEYIERFLP